MFNLVLEVPSCPSQAVCVRLGWGSRNELLPIATTTNDRGDAGTHPAA